MEVNNSNFDFGEQLKNRTKDFALAIIELSKNIPKTDEGYILKKQLIRSTAANYRTACRGRSKAEFFAKLRITREEDDESVFWLELISKTNIMQGEKLNYLLKEAKEVVAILTKSRATLQKQFPSKY
jgi:four helix bundle protein